MKRFVCLIMLFVVLLSACKRRNNVVLSASELENILYDLYIGEGVLAQDYSGVQDQSKRRYLLSVLDKHDVTVPEYDSTLVWYAEHTDEYLRVYEKLIERMQRQQTNIQKELDVFNAGRLSPKGDSVSLFAKPRYAVLYPFLNKRSWNASLSSDKNYAKINRFYLNYVVAYKADTATQLIVSLTAWGSKGLQQQVCDTVKGTKMDGQLTLFADSLLQRVEAKIELADAKNRAYRIGIGQLDLWRVKYDSIPDVKVDSTKVVTGN